MPCCHMLRKIREESSSRRTWPTSTGLLVGYSALAAAAAAAAAAGGTHRPGIALGLMAVVACTVATRMTAPVALASGAMGWLFYAGFIIGRHAQLAWHGAADAQWLGILLGAALCGVAASWIHARTGTRRPDLTEFGPAEFDPAWRAPVVSLVDARAARGSVPVRSCWQQAHPGVPGQSGHAVPTAPRSGR
jgi:hypothetical protein